MFSTYTALSDILSSLEATARELIEAWENAGTPDMPPDRHPSVVAETLDQLGEVLRRIDAADEMDPDESGDDETLREGPREDITRLGEWGLTLVSVLADLAGQFGLAKRRREVETLAFPFALWIARHGGEIGEHLDRVVNAAAVLANGLSDPLDLENLCVAMDDVIDATTARIQQDPDKLDPTRPWRILNLNFAIVATRTHEPRVIEAAWERLAMNLPEEMPDFLREAMLEMDRVGYPDAVREITTAWHARWCERKRMH